MHYDDIANNKQNKYPGKVYNAPSGHNGTDVYPGVPKHYTGEDVNPETFLKVLAGDEGLKKAGKKVLESGPNDHVFVFFDDHGAPDVVCFPHRDLKAMDLINTLKQMHHDKKYAKLVFYIEACESGSMFYKILPTDINIYATTASKPDEGSDACYYDKDIKNYLGDTYSVNWIINTESATKATTFQEQFDYVKANTPNSVPQQYGDLSIAKLPISLFLGSRKNPQPIGPINVNINRDVGSNRDVPLLLAQKSGDFERYQQLVTGRQFVDNMFSEYVNSIQHLMNANNDVLNTRLELNNRECYHNFVDTFKEQCLQITKHTYVLGKLYTFVNICEQINDLNAAKALNQLVQYCQQNLSNGYPIAIL
ncbi:unnamed protein product [Medioppia subpectinata]|uniref:Legumain prodomain domain-containing protein n=1 Tax=Medioppia subpectinata TaxID=1979941 RepID=A0A7R9QEI8_9ACAR|nr:unnamed protein product [Medioppia subpectinata]CAG2118625.1 unnamed protein product [Medioppia subpectinata]